MPRRHVSNDSLESRLAALLDVVDGGDAGGASGPLLRPVEVRPTVDHRAGHTRLLWPGPPGAPIRFGIFGFALLFADFSFNVPLPLCKVTTWD